MKNQVKFSLIAENLTTFESKVVSLKITSMDFQSSKRRKIEDTAIDVMEVLSVVLNWLVANPSWTTSNLALTCRTLHQQCQDNVRTNRYDVSLTNLKWFEFLGESRYWLCVYAADRGNTDFIDTIITSDQVTSDTFEEFLYAIAKRDDTRMFLWAKHKFPHNDWDEVSTHFVGCGAVKILERNWFPVQWDCDYGYGFEEFMRLRNHNFLTIATLSENVLNNLAKRWSLQGLQYLYENWVGFNVEIIYEYQLKRKDPYAIDWIWETFSSTVDLKKITTDIVMNPAGSTRYNISLSVFKVLHKRCKFDLLQIQALSIDIHQAKLYGYFQKVLIWILETTNHLPEANYFCLLCSENIQFEKLERFRKFNFTKDQAAYLESITKPRLIKKLLDCNFPQTSRLVEIAVSQQNIKLCEFYLQYPKLRTKFRWPAKLGNLSDVKFLNWLENIIPIDESKARTLAEQTIKNGYVFVFKWLLDRISGDYERLKYLIQDYYDGTLAFAMVLYRKQKLVLNTEDSYEWRHGQIVLDFWSDYPEYMCYTFDWDLVHDFETYKKWESHMRNFDLDAHFRDTMSERDFQLYLQTKNKSGGT